jgi:hypothetical protein
MSHLSTSELKEQVEEKLQPVGATDAPAAQEDPRDKEEYTFSFDWTNRRGRVYRGRFVNKILSIGDRQAASILAAQFSGGLPLSAVAEDIIDLNAAIAHMSYSLIQKPDWAKDLRTQTDVQLVLELWKEVARHEARFHRLGEDQASGEQAA